MATRVEGPAPSQRPSTLRPGEDLPFDPATGDWRPSPSTAPSPPAAGAAGGSPGLPGAPSAGTPQPTGPQPDDRRPGLGPRVWDVILGITLVGMALAFLLVGLLQLLGKGGSADLPEGQEFADALWAQVAINFVGMAVIPLAWGLGTRVVPVRGTLRYFRLERPWPDAAWGVLAAAGILAAMALVGGVALKYDEATGGNLTDNPELARIQDVMTWPLAVALAASAAIGEEVLFRGFLQRRIGLWGQAVLFGLAHMAYGTVLQVVLPFALGVLFGVMVKRRGNLWMPIVAHFLYDVVVVSSPLWMPDA